MLASINPLGERARGNRWGRTVTWYVAGSIAGGLVLGALVGTVGAVVGAVASPSPEVRASLVIAAAAVAFLLDAGTFGLRVPTNRRQVDETWIATYRPWLYAGGFGFQLGLGVVTIVTTACVYLVVVLVVLTGSIGGGLVVGGVFGVARAVPILVVRRASDPATLRAVLRRVQSRAATARRAALAALAALVAVTLVVVASAAGAG